MPGPGEFVVAVSYLSIDPAMRRWIDAASPSYVEQVPIGAVMEAGAVARVTVSEHAGFAVGDHVYGAFGVQDFACSDGTGVTKLAPLLAPLPTYLGALGVTGLTAYFGLLDVGRPSQAETVVVSGAAGAVGNVAGQIAKIKGCRAIGVAGGPEKCRWIVEDLGFDAAIVLSGGVSHYAAQQARGPSNYLALIGRPRVDDRVHHPRLRRPLPPGQGRAR